MDHFLLFFLGPLFSTKRKALFISAGESWFPTGVAGRGSDRRANGLPNLYKQKLVPLDARFHGTPDGPSGPLVRRLQSFGRVRGLVVGPWGECSKDMHALIKVLGETKVATRARARGRQASDNELGVVISQLPSSGLKVCACSTGFASLERGQRQQPGDGTWLRGWKYPGRETYRPIIRLILGARVCAKLGSSLCLRIYQRRK